MASFLKLSQLIEHNLSLTGIHLYFVRHGQSLGNHAGSIVGWTDSKLSIKGREQANKLFRGFYKHIDSFTEIHSSDLSRAMDTLNISLGFPNKQIRVDPKLRQMNFGEMEGVHFDSLPENQKKVVNNIEYQAPNGQNWRQARQRAMEYLKQLKPGHHLIYTHGGLMCSLMYNIGIKQVVPNCSVLGAEMCTSTRQLSKLTFKWIYEQ